MAAAPRGDAARFRLNYADVGTLRNPCVDAVGFPVFLASCTTDAAERIVCMAHPLLLREQPSASKCACLQLRLMLCTPWSGWVKSGAKLCALVIRALRVVGQRKS